MNMEVDVNIEYEKLFGKVKSINLFDSDEEYETFRQYIISQPKNTIKSSKLPFDGITLLPYKEKKNQNQTLEIKNKDQILVGLLNGIANYVVRKANRHIFYIEESGVCSASGYMEENSKLFFIEKGSLVSKESDIIYASSQSGKARLRFLDKACALKSNFYCVTKDAKCRSASSAACYVLGRKADFSAWRDINGKSLVEVYPNLFFTTKPDIFHLAPSIISDEPPLFYIVKTNDTKRACCAFGTYDSKGNQFLILKDSILSLEVSSSYRYTSSDYLRQKFIKLNCVKKSNGFVMKRDALCDSPSAAASFVLGRFANGWLEWKDESNKTLKEIYNH